MRKLTRKTGKIVPALVAGALMLSGCDLEVLNPGAILDEDLNTPELMPIVVNGVSAEFNDVMDNASFDIVRLTDDLAGTGSYFATGQYRLGRYDEEDSGTQWEQTHEAAWAAGEAWDRLQNVLGASANSDVNAAKLFALMGHAHRMLGEQFCFVTYDVGPVQAREAAFDSAIVAFNQAITIGAAAGSGADDWVTLAHAGKAQAYMAKGDWTNAVASAGQVPTDFVYSAIYNSLANDNEVWEESHGRAETGLTGSPALVWGVNLVTDGTLSPDGVGDERVPYTVCGVYDAVADENVSTGDCAGSGSGAFQGADGLTAHIRQDKFPEEGSDIPVAKGTEMRLIEAEAELMAGDLQGFIDAINEVRQYHNLPDYPLPTDVGEPEYPNVYTTVAYDETTANNAAVDAWSILDKERYVTNWLEARRWFDLWRWDHPFIYGGELIGAPAENPRQSCMQIPELECTLNNNLSSSDCEADRAPPTNPWS
jgi:hypothetical protein